MFRNDHTLNYHNSEQRNLSDGVTIGYGQIDKRLTFVFSQELSSLDEFLCDLHTQKICKVMDLAIKNGAPIVGLNSFGQANIQKSVANRETYTEILLRNTRASGVIPQISVILNSSVGHALCSAAITDFVVTFGQSSSPPATNLGIRSTALSKGIATEDVDDSVLREGAHFDCSSEVDWIHVIRRLISYIPSNNTENPPRILPTDSPTRIEEALNAIIPDSPSKPYDMKLVIGYIVDDGDFFEVQKHFATNIIIGFARLNGHTVGIVAQQPKVLAGVLDISASSKAARFVRFCDCFNIPILTLVDVPGFLPGVSEEYKGIIRHGAKLVYAYAEATVPKVTVVLRKAYGGAYVISSKHLRSDINYAWPTAEIAVMGAEGAANILFKAEIDRAEEPNERRRELISEYSKKYATPYIAASLGYIDEIIEPSYTRIKIITALQTFKSKRDFNPLKKHGNIPL